MNSFTMKVFRDPFDCALDLLAEFLNPVESYLQGLQGELQGELQGGLQGQHQQQLEQLSQGKPPATAGAAATGGAAAAPAAGRAAAGGAGAPPAAASGEAPGAEEAGGRFPSMAGVLMFCLCSLGGSLFPAGGSLSLMYSRGA